MRPIDADALRNAMYHEAFETDTDMQRWDSGCWIRYKMFENVLEKMPTVSPQVERKTGRWVECDHEKWIMGVHALRCSECNGGYHLSNEMTIYYWNYCPVCGTKMEVE